MDGEDKKQAGQGHHSGEGKFQEEEKGKKDKVAPPRNGLVVEDGENVHQHRDKSLVGPRREIVSQTCRPWTDRSDAADQPQR